MKMSENVDKVMPALLKVKGSMEAVKKDSKNPFFKSNYASLNNYLEGIEPILQLNGLVLLQPSEGMTVTSMIIHAESGQYVSSSMDIVVAKDDMQARGSGQTYARRYTLAGLLAFATENDDDGNFVSGKTTATEKFLAKPTTSNTVTTPPVEVGSFKRGFTKTKVETKTTGGNEWS